MNVKSVCYRHGTHWIFNFLGLKIKINIHRLFVPIVNVLDGIIAKNRKKIVINADATVNDNAIAYYNYLYEHYKLQYEIIWVATVDDFDADFHNKYSMYSLKGMYHFLTCKYVVICTPNRFLDYFKSKKRIYFNLYHGMPIKLVGIINKQNLKIRAKVLYKYKFLGENAHHFVTSDLFQHIMNSCFSGKYDYIHIVGQPKTDMIWDEHKRKNTLKLFDFEKYNKVVFYLPTYKEGINKDKYTQVGKQYNNIFYMDDFEQSKFVSMIEEKNILFVMKPHPKDENFYRDRLDLLPKSKNFKIIFNDILEDNGINIYNTFSFVDLMISDFSSVALDYLILNRPVIYLDNLSEDYSENRGMTLMDNYHILMLGDKVKTYKELENSIIDNLENDCCREDREKFLPLIHKYRDNKSCERIFNIMRDL